MPVDPHAQAILDALAEASAGTSVLDASPEQMREGLEALGALSIPAEVAEVVDQHIEGPDVDVPIRLYRPEGEPAGALVWFHGGGWCIGSLDSTDGLCRLLSRRAGVVVISVGYRLAPEHPYPAGLRDATAALAWTQANASVLGVDPGRIAVGGDSAGGNLAALVALDAPDSVAFQLLVYPSVDLTRSHPSIEENAEGYLLTRDHMTWFVGHYLGPDDDPRDPRISPLQADLAGAPPALVVTAEYDPLRDEGQAYAKALAAAGVEVEVRNYDGMIHAFFQLSAVIPSVGDALDHAAAALREGLER